jgi:hypothetical protein
MTARKDEPLRSDEVMSFGGAIEVAEKIGLA